MESFSETFDLCAGIRGILDGYPASNAILRELIQNSDDAGSRRQIFILDERQHPTRTLLVPGLACCQGPALLAVNDSIFRPQDWQAIKTIHHSSKADDNTQIGKYGLGFRSSYHVTDFPQILSSRTLVVFDPHMTVLNDGGRKHSTFLPADSTHEDQLAAFSSAVPADCRDYNGTVIRLPLRTSSSAKKISSFMPSIDWVKTLFSDFANKECAIEMLFLKSLESIELVHIDARGNRKELAMSRIVDADGALRAKRKWTVRAGPAMDHYPLTIQTRGVGSSLKSTSWRILHWFAQDGAVLETLREELGSARKDLKDDLKKDKLFAHAACAFPTDRAVADAGGLSGGHLFTLLPLPILTGFPVHVHGIFALTPTRQALKNPQETGLAGRDAMLVAWNKMMFTTVVPAAWAQLLDVLANEQSVADIYALWPDTGLFRDAYWDDIAASILKVVVKSELRVWPVRAVDKPVFVGLSSALVAPPATEPELLRIVKRLDIIVVAPPAGLHAILSSQDLKFEPLCAETLYKRLKKAPHVLNRLDAEERRIIAEYLVAPPADASCIIGLDLIPLSDGTTFSALLQGSCSDANIVVLCDSAAASLFGGCGRMLAAVGQMGPRFRQVLGQLALRQRGAYNLTALTPAIVRSFLLALTSHIPPDADESACMPERVPWALEFWAWVSQWSGSPQLFPLIRDFHLLPTRKETCRKLSSGILACEAKFPDTLAGKVLHKIGVPFLHDGAAGYVAALQQAGCARNPRDLRFILDTVDVSKCADLSKQHADALKRHLATIITASYTVSLDAALRCKLAALPIFSLVSTRLTRSGAERVTRLGPAVGKVAFVGQDVTAVPVLLQETFLDSPDSVFRAALQAGACLDEQSLLERAAPHLDAQPPALLDYLLYRILCRWTDLSIVARNDIRRRKALPVTADGTKRLPLCEAIDPAAAIARLFGMEENVFPAGRFDPKGPWSSLLTGAGVLQSDLTEAIVHERIRYFRARMPDERLAALELLALADAYHCQHPATRWSFPLDVEFLPHPRDKRPLLSLCGCRDGKDGHLFDLVLPVIALKQPIASNALRNALGWTSNVPFDIILRQLACIVNCDAGIRAKHSERLIKIIQSLAPRLQSMPAATLAAFRDVIGEAEWIPVSRAVLRRTSHVTHDVDLGPFKRLPTSLLEPQKFAFLEAMGCTRRPALRALTTELRLVGPQAQDVDLILAILKEIAMYHDLDVAARAELLIPDVSGKMHAPDDICFNNVPGRSVDIAGHVALCHPGLALDIAERLDLRRLSDMFANRAEDEDEDEDDEDFGEDLYDRIRGVLRDYSPNFALNEFIANANDAKATAFTAILDETEQTFTAALSPELAECQAAPALLLYNDGVFTEADFHRIRRFGRTKEIVEQHAIGQFGLGALNFYHFSDVAMVISGAFVLFIDPSKAYIPQKQRSSKRATLKYKLSVLNKASPQHLARVDGLFGFDRNSESFTGTIIVLPLRSPARAGTSRLSNAPLGAVEMHNLLLGQYLEFARDSLFCTTLHEISCRRRQAGGGISELWKVEADRARLDSPRGFLQRISLQVHIQSQQSRETWYAARTTIFREDVPANVQDSVRKDTFDVTLIATSARPPERSRILSTVPMPVQTALPIHISAPFIMASDRRTIRLEPPDAAGRRTSGSEFNSWLLESIVPPAYLTLLGMLGHAYSSQRSSLALWDWFPASTHDVVSQIVSTAFYLALPGSQHEVIHTASKRLVSPQASVLCRNAYESRSYNSLLFRLRPDDLFCPSGELLRFPPAFKGFTTVSAEYARRVLLAKQLSLQRVLGDETGRARTDMLRPDAGAYNGVAILLASIESTLCYLLDSDVALDGLRVLPLANGELGTLGSQAIVYSYSNSIAPPVSFSRSRFIDPRLTLQTRERLVLAVSNIRTVNSAQSVRDLLAAEVNLRPQDDITATGAIHECIDKLWSDIKYERIRDVSADNLADMPMLRTDTDSRYVSLNFCRQGRAIFPPSNPAHLNDVVQELKHCGMLFCDDSVRHILPSAEHAALEFTLPNVLRGLTHLGGVAEVFGVMQRPERFARWVRNNLSTGGQRLHDVHRLPIWVAYGAGGQQSLMPADSLCMLPQLWSSREALAVLPQFIPPSTSFVAWDWTLDQLLQKFQKLDTQQAFGRLTFPVRCYEAQLADFHALLELLRSTNFTNTSNKAVIPDGSLSVRPPQTLYDHRTPLFASAFQTTSETAFAHEALHGLIEFLVDLGVRRDVKPDTFLAAARAIHDDSGSQSPEFITRADVVVEAFMNDVPQTMRHSDSQRWYEIRSLCFVPTTTGTVQDLTFNASGYLPNTDAVVSPAEIVRPEFETIAWTQCARLPRRLTPPPGFLSAFPDFGKPSVATVVAHLKTLATVVAMGHSGNPSLFTCLRDTYQWLNNCADQAKAYLTPIRHLPLFLNIDSSNDVWTFKPASQLAVGLLYDADNLFRVRDWLHPFNDLLLAAGALTIVQAEFQRPAPPEGSAEARLAVLDTMRHSKVLTDCEFVSHTGRSHAAHKVVLASGCAHLRESFSGEWSDSSTRHLDETDFCIDSALSFLYVGRVERPVLQTNEEAGEMLGELLELLRLADMWNLPGLKDEVTTIIAGDLKLVGPTTVHEIARQAATWHADTLKRYCDEFIRKNRSALDKLDI